jgi:hypothetical protein
MWWAAGAGVALALLMVGAVQIWGAWQLDAREVDNQYQTFDRSITTLVFSDFRSGDIEVTTGEPGRVEVRRELKWTGSKPVFTETWSGETLTVSHDCRGRIGANYCAVRYIVKVPTSVAVKAEASSGNVHLSGLTGDLRLQTTSGDVTIDGASAALSVTTTSGNVSLKDIRSPKVEASASSGDIDLAFSQAPQSISIQTTSGNVTARVPDDNAPYFVEVRTTSGDRRITVDQSQDAGRAISVHATSGDVTIGYR